MSVTYEVTTDQGTYDVTLDREPAAPADLNRLLKQALAGGAGIVKEAAKTGDLRGAIESRARPLVGQVGAGIAEAMTPLVAPVGGAMLGAAKGAALGAPLGPPGAFLGGLTGATLGAAGGQVVNEAVGAGYRALEGLPQPPVADVLRHVGQQGLGGFEGQLLFGTAAGMVTGSRAAISAAREATARTAQGLGIQLTAAEASGNPVLRAGQAGAMRTVTAFGTMRRFGEEQAGQIVRAGEQIGLQASGPLLDPATRSNRFVEGLKGVVERNKQTAGQMFDAYVQAAGPKSLVDMAPVMAEAQAIRGDIPLLKSLQNSRLTAILKDFERFQARPDLATLEEVRKIRSALGDIAFPDRLMGAVTVDAPVAAARRLYGSLSAAIDAQAVQAGAPVKALLDQANQFYRLSVTGLENNAAYAALVAHDRNLGAFARTLFNPRDPGMLQDAKAIVSDDGWKLLQQQYWDDVFTGIVSGSKAEGGAQGFRGRQFAERIARDTNVLNTLYPKETAKAIREFADVARTADPTTTIFLNRDFTMALVLAIGQGAIAGKSGIDLVTGQADAADYLNVGLNIVAPYAMAKVLTNPTATRILTAAVKSGGPTRQTIGAIVDVLGRAAASAVNVDTGVKIRAATP